MIDDFNVVRLWEKRCRVESKDKHVSFQLGYILNPDGSIYVRLPEYFNISPRLRERLKGQIKQMIEERGLQNAETSTVR